MATRTQIRGDFGSGQGVSDLVAKAAARKVVTDAVSTDDATLLLDMLGLIPPQPGYEIKKVQKARGKGPRKSRAKHPQDKRIANVNPEEYGE